MGKQAKAFGVCAALIAAAALVFAAGASAKLTGGFAVFQNCPYTTAGVDRCVYAVTNDGVVTLGKKEVPITKPVVLQGGYTQAPEEGPEANFARFATPTSGETLERAPQPVPGGLVGLVPPEGAPLLVKAALKLALENGFTGVNATLELARPVNEILISELHLAEGEGVALVLPVKVHLENPFLGSSCYIGSSTNPVIWELTAGETNPPGPNTPISGKIGNVAFLEGGRILRLTENVLVDNAWGAPKASGCGGILAALVDPIIALQLGSTEPGNNTAILENTITEASSLAVNKNNVENP